MQIGVIGLGYWGPNLVRNFRSIEGATVAVCCDLDSRRFRSISSHYDNMEFTVSAKEVIEDPKIDAIAIATPVNTHHELAKQALQAGKSVLVEKPLSMRVEDAEELVTLADRKGLVLQVDHVFVYTPAVKQVKEIVDSGRLGSIFFIDSVRINLGLFQHDVNVIWDLAPHDLSIVDHLLGRMPRSLSAFGGVHANKGIEDVAYLNLDFGDGLIANFHVNWLSPVKVRSMIIGGSEQSLIYNDLDQSEKIKVYNRGINVMTDEQKRRFLISYRTGDIWSPNISHDEPLYLMAADFVHSIKNKRRPLADGQAGLRVVRILEAAQRSIKAQGGRVML
ncbi:MAG TPA: Gfo/Idh/MocA family oxidoreductase [Candidatus Binataceae bacterium]|nr:Gfo/Idh/MocA family oxidoreductase [Candidatus Binataceae bacterium]